MNQNKNTPYYIYNDFSLNKAQASNSPSIFNFQQSAEQIIEENKNTRKEMFSSFIASREMYLNSLKKLGDNWISGTSKQPSEKSIDISKKLLSELGSWYSYYGYKDYIYPKVIMGPIPSGGIAMQIDISPNLIAYFSISGDNVNYEVEDNGFFSEYQINVDDLSCQLLTLYKRDERGYYSKQ